MEKKEALTTVLRTSFIVFILLIFISYIFSASADSTETTAILNLVIPLQINSINLTPVTKMVLIHGTFNATMNATGGSAIDKEYAIITLPNGSSAVEFLPMNYSPSIKGVHNITFFVNDTAGNVVNSSNIFLVGNQKSTLRTTLVNGTDNDISSNLTTYLSEGSLPIYNFTCTQTCSYDYLTDFLYDYEYLFENGLTKVTLKNVNNTIDQNNAIKYQKHTNLESGNVLTAAISTNYTSFNSATLIMNYSDATYTYEGNLSIYKCSSWNFTLKNCSSTWNSVTTQVIQNTNLNLFEINTTSFSAYRITEPVVTSVCGDGTCNGAETGATCPADCTTTTIITNTVTHTSTSIKTIETIIEKMIAAPEERIAAQQLYFEIIPGKTDESRVNVENPSDKAVTVRVETEGDIGEFISFENSEFNLESGDEEDILIKIKAEKDAIPGMYYGSIVVQVDSRKTKLSVSLKVLSSEEKLLDVKVNPAHDIIYVGEDLPVEIELYNFGVGKKVDVNLKTQILTKNEKELISELEDSIAVQTSTSVLRTFKNPFKSGGQYVIRATAKYINNDVETFATSSYVITVIDRRIIIYFIEGLISVSLLIMGWFTFRNPLSHKISDRRIFFKNISWPRDREINMMFIVCKESEPIQNTKIMFEGKSFGFKQFTGSIEKFFKYALKSGPIMTKSGDKIIFAIKNSENNFISLFKHDEFGIEFLDSIKEKPKIYFVDKKHHFSIETDMKLWDLLENKQKGIEYFRELLDGIDRMNMRADVLKQYIQNIISILR